MSDMTLGELLHSRAESLGSKPYGFFNGRVLSYSELDERVERLAGGLLRHGVKPGDTVVVWFGNCLEAIETYFAVARIGAVSVPLNPMFTPREVEYVINDSRATALVGSGEFAPKLDTIYSRLTLLKHLVLVGNSTYTNSIAYHELLEEPALGAVSSVHVEPDDVAMILYTSGTTGDPKGAMLTHAGLIENARMVVSAVGFTETDRSICALPLYHLFAIAFDMLQMMVAGGSTAIVPRFESQTVAAAIDHYRCSVFIGVPTMYIYLFHYQGRKAYDLTSLRIGDTGGGPVPAQLKHEIEEEFGMTLLESYGLTEASPVVTIERPDRPRKLGSCGIALPGISIKIVGPDGKEVAPSQVGEITVRGSNVMKGYLNRPRETAEALVDGWLRTGDLARKDEEGYLFMVDRLKEMIITGGFNIYPKEVENVLYQHRDVVECAVVGVSHEEKGEIPKAYVVIEQGSHVTVDDLFQHCRQNLAAYKVPRLIELVPSLPKTATGKIRKYDLKNRVAEKYSLHSD